MSKNSKWFVVAQEGATTDGRNIERSWIQQMAASYDPKKFGARINLEHYRGIDPKGLFKSYGDVIAVKSEERDSKLCLLAQIDPTPDLIELNKARQKVFTSIEVNPNFADTGGAYLVGLAVTDDPASLGTEYLQFAAGQGEKSPLASRKQHKDNLFTAAQEVHIEFEADTSNALLATAISGLSAVVAKFTAAPEKPQSAAPAAAADTGVNAEELSKFMSETVKVLGDIAKDSVSKADFNDLQRELTELKTQLADAPGGHFNHRNPATGGNSQGDLQTDC